MMLDQVAVRDAARAGPADTYGLIWMAEILLRIRRSRARCVPDEADSHRYWQSLADTSACPLTCVRTGPNVVAHVLLSSSSDGTNQMIDQSHVPTPLHSLMPLLDEWAVTDDLDRSRRVEDATIEQPQDLVIRVDAADQACTKS